MMATMIMTKTTVAVADRAVCGSTSSPEVVGGSLKISNNTVMHVILHIVCVLKLRMIIFGTKNGKKVLRFYRDDDGGGVCK